VDRPEGFDLATAWEAVSGEIDRRRRAVSVVIHASPWVARIMRTQFGTDVEQVRELDDGRSEVTIGAPSAEIIADQLAGWGKEMEVVGPPEVRAHLARIGAELVERYAAGG
jgi:predicted DNA-binding transcriptional regulator YafY